MGSLTDLVAEKVNGVIPMAVDYDIAYQGRPNVLERIDFPINTDRVKYVPPTYGKKVRIYNAVQKGKYGFKGTRFFDEAVQLVRERYGDGVDLVRTESIPYGEYVDNVIKADIVLDQTNSSGPGMSALFVMAMGRVVLSGAKPEYLASMRLHESPIVNANPDVKYIYDALVRLIEMRGRLGELGLEGRRYVERHHNYKTIGRRFIDTWQLRDPLQ